MYCAASSSEWLSGISYTDPLASLMASVMSGDRTWSQGLDVDSGPPPRDDIVMWACMGGTIYTIYRWPRRQARGRSFGLFYGLLTVQQHTSNVYIPHANALV